MQQDVKLNYLTAIYLFLIMALVGDGIVRSKDLAWNQIIAFCLIIAPNAALIILRTVKIIKNWFILYFFLMLLNIK